MKALPQFSLRTTILLIGVLLMTCAFTRDAEGSDRSPATAKSTQEAYVGLKLTARDASGTVVATDKAIGIYLHSDATDGWDFYDASKIIPSLTDEFTLLAFVGKKNGEQTLKAQESRPYTSDSVDVVETRLVRSSALPSDLTYTLSVVDWYQMPQGWSIKIDAPSLNSPMLFDSASSSYTFTLTDGSVRAKGAPSSADTTETVLTSEVRRGSSLPVELATFTANTDGESVQLRWRTASETNNAGFYVEHRRAAATGGTSWSTAGFVDGAGTTTQSQSYRFDVDDLTYGTHEFRLRQVDTDGTVHYSGTVRAERLMTDRVQLKAYPNPFADQVSVSISTRTDQSVTVGVYDITGRRVLERKATVSANSTRRLQLTTNRLSAGTYLLQVRGDTFQRARRVVHVE